MDERIMPTIKVIQRGNIVNPMELSPVIICILKHSSISDIKEFRLVSREWNSISQPFLRRRSKISFYKYNESDSDRNRTPSSFMNLFGEDAKILPFSSFKFTSTMFQGPNPTFWTESELSSFFQTHSNDINELELMYVNILAPEWKKTYDMTDLISNSAFAKSKEKPHTRIKIECLSCNTALQVSLQVLTSIKEISLSRCQVMIGDCENLRMKPISLHLQDVKFFRNGSLVLQMCLNDVVDWSRIKDITISSYYTSRREYSELTFDSKGEMELKSLTYNSVPFLNVETFQSEFKVQKLILDNTPFVHKTKLLVKELEFHGHFNCNIDLCALPSSVERLFITDAILAILSQPAIIVPNLKSLIFNNLQFDEKDLSSVMSRFVHCSNLVTITLIMEYAPSKGRENEFNLDVKHIPKSVKRIKLKGVDLHNVSNITLNTETLILDEFSLNPTRSVLIYFQTKTLVWKWQPWERNCKTTNEEMLQCLNNIFGEEESNPAVVYIGPFDWEQSPWNQVIPFEDSPFSKVVDQESEYYIFRKGKGTAINEEHFDEVMELENTIAVHIRY